MRPLVLWLIALALHAAWATTLSVPVDWDPAYYASVAQHIVAGDGAVTGSLVFLGELPQALPMAADQHWSPLPSRVLVPGVWLWPSGGAQAVTVMLAAAWAPLAWALARPHGERVALWAGALAATGAGYARMISTPDSIALAGVLGGLAFLALQRERWVLLALALSALVLTRGDGLVAAVALGVAARDRRALPAVALAGLTWGAWKWGHPGDPGLYSATHYAEWVLGHEPTGSRVTASLVALKEGGVAYLIAGAGLLPAAALAGAWMRRDLPFAATTAALLLAAALLAPALAESGTLYRSGAVVAVAGCALAAHGIDRLSRWGVSARGYPTWLIPGLLIGGGVICSLGLGGLNARLMPASAPDCSVVQDDVVFATRPLILEATCGGRAVLFARGSDDDRIAALAERFGITRVVTDDGVMTIEEARAQGVGW